MQVYFKTQKGVQVSCKHKPKNKQKELKTFNDTEKLPQNIDQNNYLWI